MYLWRGHLLVALFTLDNGGRRPTVVGNLTRIPPPPIAPEISLVNFMFFPADYPGMKDYILAHNLNNRTD